MSAFSQITVREAAKGYRELGWFVIPVNGKKPRTSWKKRQPHHKSDPLFDDPKTTGLAVVLGSPSRNLVAID
jgi:hypothetical protein